MSMPSRMPMPTGLAIQTMAATASAARTPSARLSSRRESRLLATWARSSGAGTAGGAGGSGGRADAEGSVGSRMAALYHPAVLRVTTLSAALGPLAVPAPLVRGGAGREGLPHSPDRVRLDRAARVSASRARISLPYERERAAMPGVNGRAPVKSG